MFTLITRGNLSTYRFKVQLLFFFPKKGGNTRSTLIERKNYEKGESLIEVLKSVKKLWPNLYNPTYIYIHIDLNDCSVQYTV